jgi:molecular chaperone HscB
MFDLPVALRLDLDLLDERYRRAQIQVHPDRFVGKTPLEQNLAAEQSLVMTEAYQRLKSPLLRAQEILKARGLPVPGSQEQTVQDPEILMEVMELRDQLYAMSSTEELTIFEQELQEKLSSLEDTFMDLPNLEIPVAYLRFVYLTKLIEDTKRKNDV